MLAEERGVLLPLAAPWEGEVLRPATDRARPPRREAAVIQHPLSVYDGLLAPGVLQ